MPPARRLPPSLGFRALLVLGLLVPAAALAHGRHDQDEAPLTPRIRTATAEAAPTRPSASLLPRRYYLAMDDHTDYMWSADDTTYRGVFLRMLDYYMTQAETTAYRPVDHRGRFNTDGTIWLWEYERNRTPAQFQRLMNHVRAGNVTVPLNLLVELYGAMPTEAVIRSFSYAGRIERRENVRFRLVVPMEDQTLPGGVGSIWAGCGARYAWKGICDCATQIDAANRPRDIYRFTGPDGQSVLMKWQRMYGMGSTSIGGYAEARNPADVVDFMTSDSDFLDDWPWDVAGAFGYGWDDLETKTDDLLDAARDLSTANRRVIVSNEVDFFQDFEATHGPLIGSYGAGFGNEWELNTASLAEVTARMRRGVERLRTGEALATVASQYDPALWTGLAALRDSAMLACGLYYEHSWSAGPGVSEATRAAWQRRIERAMTRYADSLLSASAAAVALRIRQPAGVERHAVFNPLSWARTDVVDLTSSVPAPRHVVDVATGTTLPSQTVTVDGVPRLRVRVAGVPSVGYRVLEVQPGAGATFPPAATVTLPAMDNGIYRVAVGTRGQLTSVLDHKDADRELVMAGGAIDDLGINTGAGAVTLESVGPVSATIKVSAASPMKRDMRITLYAGIDRIDLKNEVLENFGNDQDYESKFNLAGGVMRHEEVGRISRVGRLSEGGDYANENTRTDMLTMNHFLDLSQTTRGVTLSSWDSPFFRAGNSTTAILDGTTPRVRTVIGNLVNGSGNGISNQGGDSYFLDRYALRTHGVWDAPAAMRFALEHQNPLVALRVMGGGNAPLPDTAWSLVDLGSSDVLLWALKPAEEGIDQGIIARVWNLATAPRAITLKLLPLGIASAMQTTHIETNEQSATVAFGAMLATLTAQQIGTWRLTPGSVAGAGDGLPQPRAILARPNPARAADGAVLAFALARAGHVTLELLDLRGARVARLLDQPLTAGAHEVRWDARGADGRRVPPGLYFTRLRTPDGDSTGRIVVLE